MAAYAEGLDILQERQHRQAARTRSTPKPRRCAIRSTTSTTSTCADIAEVWRRGSVIASWLLDLTAAALVKDPAAREIRRPRLRFGRRALDDQGRHRRSGAGAGAHDRAVRALQLARRSRFPGQAALGDALPSSAATSKSRPSDRRDTKTMDAAPLRRAGLLRRHRRPAYKKIFPSLQAMVKRGQLDVPVIGVAKAGWNLDQLKARARDSLEKHGGVDAAAFEKLCGLLRYVDGDYNDPATFQALRKELGDAAASGALPGDSAGRCSGRSSSSSPKADCAKGARVIVEKPFGRDLASAPSAQPNPAEHVRRDVDLPHRPLPRQSAGAQHAVLPLRQFVPRAVLEPQPRRERADHDGRELRRAGPRRVLRRDRARSATSSRTTCSRCWSTWRWSRRCGPTANRSATRRCKVLQAMPPLEPSERRPRPVPRLPRRAGRRARFASRDVRRAEA